MLPENLAQATLPGTLPLWLSLTLLGGAVIVIILAGVAGWMIWRKP